MSEYYTLVILLINNLDEIDEKKLSGFGFRGGQICPLMHIPLWVLAKLVPYNKMMSRFVYPVCKLYFCPENMFMLNQTEPCRAPFKSEARKLEKLRTSKGDYLLKQWFSSIASLFKMGTSLVGKNVTAVPYGKENHFYHIRWPPLNVTILLSNCVIAYWGLHQWHSP